MWKKGLLQTHRSGGGIQHGCYSQKKTETQEWQVSKIQSHPSLHPLPAPCPWLYLKAELRMQIHIP